MVSGPFISIIYSHEVLPAGKSCQRSRLKFMHLHLKQQLICRKEGSPSSGLQMLLACLEYGCRAETMFLL